MSKWDLKKENLKNLILLAQNNDIKAIETLIRREQKHIYAIFSHLTHEQEDISDLTQETLVKMANNISHLKEPEHFRAWLNKIISNTFYDFSKKNYKDKLSNDENQLNEIQDKSTCAPDEKCTYAEIENLVKKALLTLPGSLRLSIVLREYEGLSYEDISRITNTTIGTVKSRIARARLKLRDLLADFI